MKLYTKRIDDGKWDIIFRYGKEEKEIIRCTWLTTVKRFLDRHM